MSDFKTILYQVIPAGESAVALITLNRPERRNAFTPEMLDELTSAATAAEADAAVRAVVLTGAGPTFSSGQDLTIFTGPVDASNVRAAIMRHYKPLIVKLVTMAKPVIGAINGGAAGAGASLALACDLRIMADDGYLLQAFSQIGLVPDAGSTWFMARQIGYSRALQLCIEAERIPAGRCVELGLANKIAPAAHLQEAALAWAGQLAARPTAAIGWTKHALHAAAELSLEEAISLEADLQAMAIATQDHREGVTAFLQKRAPRFVGQ